MNHRNNHNKNIINNQAAPSYAYQQDPSVYTTNNNNQMCPPPPQPPPPHALRYPPPQPQQYQPNAMPPHPVYYDPNGLAYVQPQEFVDPQHYQYYPPMPGHQYNPQFQEVPRAANVLPQPPANGAPVKPGEAFFEDSGGGPEISYEQSKRVKHNQVEHRRRERIKRQTDNLKLALHLENPKMCHGDILEYACNYVNQATLLKIAIQKCFRVEMDAVDNAMLLESPDELFDKVHAELNQLLPPQAFIFGITPDTLKADRMFRRKRNVREDNTQDCADTLGKRRRAQESTSEMLFHQQPQWNGFEPPF